MEVSKIKLKQYFFNVVVWWLLVIGGMCLAGIIAPSRPFYPLALCVCLLPALLFLKYRLPVTWRRFTFTTIVLFCISILYLVLSISF